MKEAELTDLIKDWRDKANWGPQEQKIEYLERLNALTEEMLRLKHSESGMRVQAYQREDGSYTYTLKVPGAYGQRNES